MAGPENIPVQSDVLDAKIDRLMQADPNALDAKALQDIVGQSDRIRKKIAKNFEKTRLRLLEQDKSSESPKTNREIFTEAFHMEVSPYLLDYSSYDALFESNFKSYLSNEKDFTDSYEVECLKQFFMSELDDIESYTSAYKIMNLLTKGDYDEFQRIAESKPEDLHDISKADHKKILSVYSGCLDNDGALKLGEFEKEIGREFSNYRSEAYKNPGWSADYLEDLIRSNFSSAEKYDTPNFVLKTMKAHLRYKNPDLSLGEINSMVLQRYQILLLNQKLKQKHREVFEGEAREFLKAKKLHESFLEFSYLDSAGDEIKPFLTLTENDLADPAKLKADPKYTSHYPLIIALYEQAYGRDDVFNELTEELNSSEMSNYENALAFVKQGEEEVKNAKLSNKIKLKDNLLAQAKILEEQLKLPRDARGRVALSYYEFNKRYNEIKKIAEKEGLAPYLNLNANSVWKIALKNIFKTRKNKDKLIADRIKEKTRREKRFLGKLQAINFVKRFSLAAVTLPWSLTYGVYKTFRDGPINNLANTWRGWRNADEYSFDQSAIKREAEAEIRTEIAKEKGDLSRKLSEYKANMATLRSESYSSKAKKLNPNILL